jgi:hypothetical protein
MSWEYMHANVGSKKKRGKERIVTQQRGNKTGRGIEPFELHSTFMHAAEPGRWSSTASCIVCPQKEVVQHLLVT